jgi:hypothetical protein
MAKKDAVPATPERMIQVKAFLYVEDVEEMRRRAGALGFREWHPILRKLVHDALRERKIIR